MAVTGLTEPIRFSIPAAADVPPNNAATCAFWDSSAAAFNTAGCTALPNAAPAQHTVAWVKSPFDVSQPAPAQNVGGPAAAVAGGDGACRALPDREMAALLVSAAGTAEAQARYLSATAWDVTGERMCGCKVTILDCAADAAARAAAAAAAAADGASADEAFSVGERARRVIFPSSVGAIIYPSISCSQNDTKSVMRIIYGAI